MIYSTLSDSEYLLRRSKFLPKKGVPLRFRTLQEVGSISEALQGRIPKSEIDQQRRYLDSKNEPSGVIYQVSSDKVSRYTTETLSDQTLAYLEGGTYFWWRVIEIDSFPVLKTQLELF